MLRSRLESRWSSLKYLDDDSKLDLITMLTQSLKDSGNRKKISASEFYGIWGDDGMSDDEFVEALRAERKFNQTATFSTRTSAPFTCAEDSTSTDT